MRRLLKWGVVAFVLAEAYARGGREFLFGERDDDEFGVGEMIRTWVDLPVGWTPPPNFPLPVEINDGFDAVGQATKIGQVDDAKDQSGYPTTQFRVFVEAERRRFGYPINVALAQLGDHTRRSLGIG